jgi:ATP-dependent hsl protease ATP-binding subunit hslU
MDSLNQKYIGRDVQDACEDLTSKGFLVQIRRLDFQKDKDILNDEIVIKLIEEGNNITLITSMFKKYI